MSKFKIFKVGTVLFLTLVFNVYLDANNGDDDTPADIHFERGMGCIDCHTSYDVHAMRPNPNHKPLSSEHKSSLINFITNNSSESAAAVKIDLAKLDAYISNL